MALERTDEDEIANIRCGTTAGSFTMRLSREWSPHGFDRAVELFERGYFDSTHFFRVVPHFLVQFGITYDDDEDLKKFAGTTIPDDPQLEPPISFDEGVISFAGSGVNSRTSELFIAYGPVRSLGENSWETPIGKVIDGMENVHNFYSEYGDMPPWGKGPVQQRIHTEGRSYIETEYPKLDHFLLCTVDRSYEKSTMEELFNIVEGDEELGDSDSEDVSEEKKVEEAQVKDEKLHLDKGKIEADIQKPPQQRDMSVKHDSVRKTKVTNITPQGQGTDPVAAFAVFIIVMLAAVCIFCFKSKHTGVARSKQL